MRDLINLVENLALSENLLSETDPLDTMISLYIDSHREKMNLRRFFEVNEEIDETYKKQIMRSLKYHGRYYGGGGAAGQWIIRVS